jgi:hypothetical protein
VEAFKIKERLKGHTTKSLPDSRLDHVFRGENTILVAHAYKPCYLGGGGRRIMA